MKTRTMSVDSGAARRGAGHVPAKLAIVGGGAAGMFAAAVAAEQTLTTRFADGAVRSRVLPKEV